MPTVPTMAHYHNEIVRLRIHKRKGDTYALRAGRVGAQATSLGCKYFAMRYGRVWHIYPVSGPKPIKSGLTEAQAEMWLRHREKQ